MMHFFDILGTSQGWMYLFILSVLEIVLGIDNIIFISIVTDKLPKEKKRLARNIGLSLALIIRLILLTMVSLIMQMKTPFEIFGHDFTGQKIVLLLGGLFLIYKSTLEMHKSVKGFEETSSEKSKKTMFGIIFQIVLIDIIFSFDSVISAIGMTNGIGQETQQNPIVIIYIAIIISMIVMMLFAGKISKFITDNPTIKMIALSFLITIGALLVAEAFDQEIPKGYVYFALVYSLLVELLNIRMRKNKVIEKK